MILLVNVFGAAIIGFQPNVNSKNLAGDMLSFQALYAFVLVIKKHVPSIIAWQLLNQSHFTATRFIQSCQAIKLISFICARFQTIILLVKGSFLY